MRCLCKVRLVFDQITELLFLVSVCLSVSTPPSPHTRSASNIAIRNVKLLNVLTYYKESLAKFDIRQDIQIYYQMKTHEYTDTDYASIL